MKYKLNREQFHKLMLFAAEEMNKALLEKKGPGFNNRNYHFTFAQRAFRNYSDADITNEFEFEVITDTGLESRLIIQADKNYKQLAISYSYDTIIVSSKFQKFMLSLFGEDYIKHLTDLANKKYEKGLSKLEKKRAEALAEIEELESQNDSGAVSI